MAISITNLSGGNTPADGSDPRTFPAIWNATATDLEGVATDLDTLEATVGAHDLNSLSGVGITTPVEGDLLTYNGTSWVNGVPAGSILQVVSTTKTDTFSTSLASGAFSANVTGLTATITPLATSSKILVRMVVGGARSGQFPVVVGVMLRGSTAIGVGDAAGDRTPVSGNTGAGTATARSTASLILETLDSPATTSATTYNFQVFNATSGTNTFYINRTASDVDDATYTRGVSTITLMEVAG